MRLFTELKRRNVFKVGAAYVITAWLLLQVADILFDAIGTPAWAMQTLLVFLAIGFFVALFFAWAFELTPEGIKREAEVDRDQSITPTTGKKLNHAIIVLLLLAVAYLLLDKFLGGEHDTTPTQTFSERAAETPVAEPAEPAMETAPEINRQSIAVLPFENRSPVSEDEFFIDGIHDDLLTTLSRIGGLKVISRTSVSRFGGSDLSIPQIARELGVATIMEGAVQRAGNAVRINVQLIDAQTDEHLWAQIFDRELSTENLFAIQSEITQKIADALKAELTPEEERQLNERPTENLEAYSAYLRGMRAFETREVAAMKEALADFQKAVELDPEFALGWAGIAQVAEVMPSWGGMTREEGQAISMPAAERAMELAPDLGEANLALAMVLEGDEALAQHQKAVEMLPNHAMAHQWYANNLQGPPGPGWLRALELLRKAEELDPMSPNPRTQVARQLIFMNRYDEAEQLLRVVMQSDPDYIPPRAFMAWLSVGKGNLDQSARWNLEYMEADPGVRFPRQGLIFTLVDLWDRDRLERFAENWESADPNDISVLFAKMGVALLDGRYGALREMANTPGIPFEIAGHTIASSLTYARNDREALNAWQKVIPGFFDNEGRGDAIRESAGQACLVADIARRVGETELADALVNETIEFATQELPKYVEHAASEANIAYCLAYMGEFDATLDQIETNLRHRHFDSWWEPRYLELFDPLRGNPRFETLMQAFEDEMARQRANLDRLEAEGTLETGP